jgi:hypothetical protein
MIRPFLITLFMSTLFTALPLAARADFFQYTDRNGTVVMVDDESKIPAQYRNKTRTTKVAPAGEIKTTAVRFRGNQVLVPVRISYRTTTLDAWMLLDTGATLTVISNLLADRLGIRKDSTESLMSQVADGREVQTPRTQVDSLAVGPKLKLNAEVVIMTSVGPAVDFDGLLGMNFLGDFNYHLDVKNQIIEWR